MALGDPGNQVKAAIDRRAARVPRARRNRYRAAAYETSSVEANGENPSGGDADSEGWRQERKSLYKDPTNITHSVDRFFNELAQADHGQPSYELAADVQRPAAQYRGRYKEHHAEALGLIAKLGAGSSPTGRVPSRAGTRTVTTTAPDQVVPDTAAYDQAVRRQKVATLLAHSGKRDSVLFRSGLLSTAPVDPASYTTTQPGATTTRTIGGGESTDGTPTGSGLQSALKAANSYLGVREQGGNNRGPEVDKLEKGFGFVGAPWCGIYVGTVLKKAGVKDVTSGVASVDEIERMARSSSGAFKGGWHSAAHARAGDALVTRKGEHVVYVTSVGADGTIHAIGGNTGNGAVERRTYTADQVYGAARPVYGTARKPRSRRS